MRMMFEFYLLAGAVWDIRSRQLPGIWLLTGSLLGCVYAFIEITGGERTLQNLILSLLPGILFYLFAKASQAMGEGDAWLILTAGMILSFYDLLKMLFIAFSISAFASVIIVIVERKIKNQRIAFVPFLFLATAMFNGVN